MDKPTNVRPGDRAILVRPRNPENQSMVVEVVREYVYPEVLPGHYGPHTWPASEKGPWWVIESCGRDFVVTNSLHGKYLNRTTAARDSSLRPLRDSDSEDEMVSRVGRAPVAGFAPIARTYLDEVAP